MTRRIQFPGARVVPPTSRLLDGLSNEDYHSDIDSVSKSGLDDVHLSPWHFYKRHLDPDAPPRVTKAGQLEGTLLHCALLEPMEFPARYVIGPDENRNTKKWKEFEASLPSHVVGIKRAQADVAWEQAESLRALPEIATALGEGAAEMSAYWTDPDTGVACRCRPDFVRLVDQSSCILLDAKTAGSAHERVFQRTIAQKRYHVQDAFYSDGFAAASGLRVRAFIFAVVESTYPYAAQAFMLEDGSKLRGQQEYKADLRRYAAAKESGHWPGYSDAIRVTSLPDWAFYEGEQT